MHRLRKDFHRYKKTQETFRLPQRRQAVLLRPVQQEIQDEVPARGAHASARRKHVLRVRFLFEKITVQRLLDRSQTKAPERVRGQVRGVRPGFRHQPGVQQPHGLQARHQQAHLRLLRSRLLRQIRPTEPHGPPRGRLRDQQEHPM